MQIESWDSGRKKVKVAQYFNGQDISCDYFINPTIPNTIFAEFDIAFEAKYLYLLEVFEDQEVFIFKMTTDTGAHTQKFKSGFAGRSEENALEFMINKIVEETVPKDSGEMDEIMETLKKALVWKK